MRRLRNEGVVPDSWDGSVAVELYLRQEPDEDEEDDDNRNDDDHDDQEGTDDGYSE